MTTWTSDSHGVGDTGPFTKWSLEADDCSIVVQTLESNTVHIQSHRLDLNDIYRVPHSLPSLPSFPPSSKLRWIHVPVNNMQWVQRCIEVWFPKFSGLDENSWGLKLRPALSQVITTHLHARHMEPSCTASDDLVDTQNDRAPGNVMDVTMPTFDEGSRRPSMPTPDDSDEKAHARPMTVHMGNAESRPRQPTETDSKHPLLALYLPYMNWSTYQDYRALSTTYDSLTTASRASIHPRRTLDQFYYSSLRNTEARDADQTISKWTGTGLTEGGRPGAISDSLLIMVDQLWCWIIDERTVLSFFPAGVLQHHQARFTDLYTSICQNWVHCETAWDMYALLVKEASSFLFRQDNKRFTDLIETYRWVVNTKAAAQTSYFEEWGKNHAAGDVELSVLDDRRELKLVLEVTDIIDELKMIRHLAEKQREVLKALVLALRKLSPSDQQERGQSTSVHHFNNYGTGNQFVQFTSHNQLGETLGTDAENIKTLAQQVQGAARNILILGDETLVLLIAELDIMRNDADYAHKMLIDLLDLKQKAAALAEARSTSQQGRVIMLFTIVTIIFLPLSFFTSYFGQNIREISGDEGNPTSGDLWKIGAPISVVVILFALSIAYMITKRQNTLCFKFRTKKDSSA